MVAVTLYLSFFTAFALAMIRATVFLVFCPPFNNRALSGQIKALLGAALGLACMHRVEPILDTSDFLVQCVVQGFVGFAMATLVRVLIAALQMAGSLIDIQGGFAMAQTFDPLTQTNQALFARFYEMTALAMLFATNGYQLLILGLARSFDAVPVTGGFDLSLFAQRLEYQFAQLVLAGIEIAGPLLLVLFLTDMGLGLLTKVAPAMNAFTLGFPLKILLTAFLAPTIMVVIPQVTSNLVDKALKSMEGVFL